MCFNNGKRRVETDCFINSNHQPIRSVIDKNNRRYGTNQIKFTHNPLVNNAKLK